MPEIAVSSKGGVGKTTWAALLAGAYALRGDNVLAIDADPSPCLANALGFPPELTKGIVPIAEMEELRASEPEVSPVKAPLSSQWMFCTPASRSARSFTAWR